MNLIVAFIRRFRVKSVIVYSKINPKSLSTFLQNFNVCRRNINYTIRIIRNIVKSNQNDQLLKDSLVIFSYNKQFNSLT